MSETKDKMVQTRLPGELRVRMGYLLVDKGITQQAFLEELIRAAVEKHEARKAKAA